MIEFGANLVFFGEQICKKNLLIGLLKVSQYVTLTGQRKCHPFVPQSRRLKKNLIDPNQVKLGVP
jgi:hypothetical protein